MTPDLQSYGGRLDAKLIANVFGLSQKELAELLGLTVQAMRNDPDAGALQEKLHDFQRIARLRILPSASPAYF